MPRGGPRPNSGARKGNTNRMKHGRRSGQIRRAIDKLMADSDTQALLHVFSTLAPEDLQRHQETLTSYTRKYWQRSAARDRR